MTKPETTEIDLKPNVLNTLSFNRPVQYRVGFVGGSYIEGTIPANSPMGVFHSGEDIASFTITIEPTEPIRAVEVGGDTD